ncbi:piggyBac transposable element-derived protein 4-like [Gastrophryne carolinensis]
MAGRRYTAQEAAAYLMESDSEEFSESGSEYMPSGSESDSSSEEVQPRSSTSARHPRRDGTAQEEAMLEESVGQGGSAVAEGEPAWRPPNNYSPEIPPFDSVPGVNVDTTNFRLIDFLNLFVSEAILLDMVHYTNLYAEQVLTQNPPQRHARAHAWQPTNLSEMKTFWGLTLAMGIVKKFSIESYWDTQSILATPLFPAIMSRNRYEILLRFLHFNDNTTAIPRGQPGHDRLHKLRPLINSLSERFAEVYTPSQNLSIDESLLLFKGRIIFRQYIPSKRARYGIKFYKLCDSVTGYTKFFRIYEGRDTHLDPPGCPLNLTISGKIVWELMTPLLGRGYHLYVDNFYSSIPLFRALYSLDTPACGTINLNRKGLPRSMLQKKLNRGESYALRSNELLAVKYMDKKNVIMLTTIHDESVMTVRQRGPRPPYQKPRCIKDYNKFKGGVDKTDQILTYYNAARKSRAWYKKVAIHLVQLATFNSFVVFKAAVPGSNLTFIKYQQQLLPALLFGDTEEAPEMSANDNQARLVGKHFIKCIPDMGGKRYPQKACRVRWDILEEEQSVTCGT